ncbi:MAG: hypothetical protein IJI74_05215 [Firmicutes bacterium]|nr:hypothetical protein [Bacillota bacterium]
MKCGVKFCGGCNPRYDRGAAYREIKEELKDIDFVHAEEDVPVDNLLVIGGCTACCASYEQYDVKDQVFKMWDKDHIENIKTKLKAITED